MAGVILCSLVTASEVKAIADGGSFADNLCDARNVFSYRAGFPQGKDWLLSLISVLPPL